MNVAALYIDQRGPYPVIASRGNVPAGAVDCWDESRDARKYDGPHPVVAHPPCGPWGRLRHLYRGPHCDHRAMPRGVPSASCARCQGTLRINEHDCAPRAVAQVNAYGGVLEHPAGSLLWDAAGLPEPGEFNDYNGYTIEVDQCEWGHVARKRTWLYLVRVPREALEAPPFPGREPTHWLSGGRTKSSRSGSPVPPGIKVCSAQQRRRTPPLFAEYLIRLARSVKR